MKLFIYVIIVYSVLLISCKKNRVNIEKKHTNSIKILNNNLLDTHQINNIDTFFFPETLIQMDTSINLLEDISLGYYDSFIDVFDTKKETNSIANKKHQFQCYEHNNKRLLEEFSGMDYEVVKYE